MKEARWEHELTAAMRQAGKSKKDVSEDAKSARWKIEMAGQLRHIGASCGWIAKTLNMGPVHSMRSYLCRVKNQYVTP